MRTFLLSLTLLLLGASPASARSALQAIDSAYRAGEITDSQRIYYRVAAVRAPDLLPMAYRQQGTTLQRSHTAVLVDAFQQLGQVSAPEREAVRDLLLPPPDLTYTLDSTSLFPIRVSYANPSQAALAQQVLAAAEVAYQTEVLDWGFWEPPIEPAAQLYRFYVMDAGGAAGYTAPYAEVDTTANYDAYTYIVIDPSLDGVYLDTTVVHEFNHACQIAMDYAESVAFMENTSSYVEAEIYPEGWPETVLTFPYFQAQPWRPLEYKKMFDSDIYEYGGALWLFFLTQLYGDQDPRWVQQIWEGTVQEGEINEPDYFDVLDDQLAADGGLAEAVRTFSEYRFFVGADDDGQHLPDSGSWWDSEVWRTATYSTYSLPVRDAGPLDSATRPQPNGCNYVVLDLDTPLDWPLRFDFRGDMSLDWYAYVMQIDADGLADKSVIALEASAMGGVSIDTDGLERLVLVMCQMAPAGYDPDDRAWTGGDYVYDIEYDIPAPTVTGATPDRVGQGALGVPVTITGSGFVDDDELTVTVSGERVAVSSEEFVSSEELRVSLTVAPDAELGARDVVVTNPGGASGFGNGLITITSPSDNADAGVDGGTAGDGGGGTGCGCETTTGTPAVRLPMVLLLALVWLGRRRSRACKSDDI